MYRSVQVRWLEQAEGRSVREHAALQRAASEPAVVIGYARPGSAWFNWLRKLGRPLGRIRAARSPLADTTITPRARSVAAPKVAYADREDDGNDDRILVALLITDIVGSTRLAAEMGDRDWLVLLDRHDAAIRHQIDRFGGREVGNRGDGFVAIFDAPASAVCCANAIAHSVAPLGIRLRCGIHFGKVHFANSKISGIAAHIAARIAAAARPGEALVSNMVRDLVIGSGLVFEDRGIHRLRDVPDEIQVYAVRALGVPIFTETIDTELGAADQQQLRPHDGRGSDFGRIVNWPNGRVRRSLGSNLAVLGHE